MRHILLTTVVVTILGLLLTSCKCEQEKGYFGPYKIPEPVIAQMYDGQLRTCLNEYLDKPDNNSPIDIKILNTYTGIIDCHESNIESLIGIHHLINVEGLDLALNHIKEIPENLSQLSKLKQLDLSYNEFKRVPTVLAELPKLEMLSLAGNPLETLRGISQLKHLKTLFLKDIPKLENVEAIDASTKTETIIEFNGHSYRFQGNGEHLTITEQ